MKHLKNLAQNLNLFLLMGIIWNSNSMGSNLFGDMDLGLIGYTNLGRFMNDEPEVPNEFYNRAGAKLNVVGEISEKLSLEAELHWFWWRNELTNGDDFYTANGKFDSDLQSLARYSINDNHQLKFGIYDFKYNPNSKNLGEHVIRSEAYPLVLESGQGKDIFSPSQARIAGLEYSLEFGAYRGDALLFLEQTTFPVNDISIGTFHGFYGEFGEAKMGLVRRRAVSTGYDYQIEEDPTAQGSLLESDKLKFEKIREYTEIQGLSQSFTSLTLLGGLSYLKFFDEKIESKIYGEITVMGLKNDDLFYTDIWQRAPLMLGIDLYTFGILDMLSFEIEYLNYPHLQQKYDFSDLQNVSPIPAQYNSSLFNSDSLRFINNAEVDAQAFKGDDFKWSLHIQKTISKWLDIKFKIASDYQRLVLWDNQLSAVGVPYSSDTFKGILPKEYMFLFRLEWHN